MKKSTRKNFASTSELIHLLAPDAPCYLFNKHRLKKDLEQFRQCLEFPHIDEWFLNRSRMLGTISYALKANPSAYILDQFLQLGIEDFDVASPHEVETLYAHSKSARAHYNNPVRSHQEIERALKCPNLTSFSVDHITSLATLAEIIALNPSSYTSRACAV